MSFEENNVQEWLSSLKGLDVEAKKMFGCFCLYCDGQAVGWIHDSVLSLREVDLDYLPDDIKRPNKDDTVSDNMAIDSDGDLMMRMGDNMAMDMDSGELHIISGWSSDKEEED